MPIPPIADHFAAQVILKGKSGNPADVYTNTFYFQNSNFVGSPDQFADQLRDHLEDFYNVKDPGVVGGGAIATFLSGSTLEVEAEVRVYDLGNPAPRYPMIRFFDLLNMPVGVLPSEVAVCLSYVADQNQPRQRGRIYLGPLNPSCAEITNGRAQVNTNMRIGALGALRALVNINNHALKLWSPTDQTMKEITGGWMDNAFDTQRRRGEEATARMTFGSYLGQSGTQLPLTP